MQDVAAPEKKKTLSTLDIRLGLNRIRGRWKGASPFAPFRMSAQIPELQMNFSEFTFLLMEGHKC